MERQQALAMVALQLLVPAFPELALSLSLPPETSPAWDSGAQEGDPGSAAWSREVNRELLAKAFRDTMADMVALSDADDEPVEDTLDRGRLTPEEKVAVMLDFRPKPLVRTYL